jgi:hypothetical protein
VGPALRSAAALGWVLWAIACSDATRPGAPLRTFRMGFSAIPPRPDLAVLLQALNVWTASHADAAILHVSVPYTALLAGIPAKQAVDTFTDLDLSAIPVPPGSIPLFAHLGLVDSALGPKPALTVWDSVLAVPLSP